MRHFILYPITAICIACVGYCHRDSAPQAADTYVSKKIRALLPGFENPPRDLAAFTSALENLHAKSLSWCESPGISTGLARDLTPEESEAFKTGTLSIRTLLGCQSWHLMTDKKPGISIAYVQNALDPVLQQQFHCVSVGVIQPYIMTASIKCSKLTIVDLSFRALHIHALLFSLITAKDFSGITPVLVQLKRVAGVSLEDFCDRDALDECKAYLIAFASQARQGLRVELRLQSLHDYAPDRDAHSPIIYASNAPDPNFTTPENFRQIQNNFAAAGRPVVMIYHQADSKNFGVYEFNGAKITKICANQFEVSRTGRYSANRCTYYPPSRNRYSTYMDSAAVNAEATIPCQF